MSKTGFFHSVYFFIKDDAEAGAAAMLAQACLDHLAGIPGVLRLEVGFPAGTDRTVVDNSYGVMLLIEFENKAAHDSYQQHPDHLVFVDICASVSKRVQVYDMIPM